MIELQMVTRMLKRGLLLAPFVVAPLWILVGSEGGISAALGVVMALGNLWLAGRVIGGVADTRPQLLLVGAMAAFTIGLGLLTGLALLLNSLDIVSFPVTGFALVGMHLVLVLWEAARAFPVDNMGPAHNALKLRNR